MARGVVVPFTMNPREFLSGLKKIEASTEDLSDAFKDVERDADRAADGIEDSFEDAARDSENAFRDLGETFERQTDRIVRESRRFGKDVGKGIKGAEKSAGQAAGVLAGEIADEFVENWGEAVRSGDYAGAVRETLSQLGQIGGAVAGPAGALIGGGLALALTAAFDETIGRSQRIQTAVDGTFEAIVVNAGLKGGDAAQAFARGYADEEDAISRLIEATGTENINQAVEEIGRIAEASGLSVDTVTQAFLGNRDALQEVQDKATNLQTTIDNLGGPIGRTAEGFQDMDSASLGVLQNANDTLPVVQELLTAAQEQATANETASTNASTYDEVLDSIGSKAADLVIETKNANVEAGLLTGTASDVKDQLNEAGLNAKRIKDELAGIPKNRTITVYVDYVEKGKVPRG